MFFPRGWWHQYTVTLHHGTNCHGTNAIFSWWHQYTVSDSCMTHRWEVSHRDRLTGVRWIRKHGAGELILTHGTPKSGRRLDFWDGRRGRGWPGLAYLRSSCLQVLLKAWLSHLYTSDSWGHVGSVLSFSFPLFYQGLTVSSILIHSCSACHKNSFGSSHWPIEQSTSTFCDGFTWQWQSFQTSPSVFLLIFIRPVWCLRQVGWQRGSCPPLSETSVRALAHAPNWKRAGLANQVVTLLVSGERLLCPGTVSVAGTLCPPRRSKMEHCGWYSFPLC